MLEINDDNLKSLTIDLKLTEQQRAILYAYVQQQGFDIIQQLMEEEIRRIHVHHMNTDIADKTRMEATFVMAKAVAMFYKGFISSLEQELQLHKYNAQKLGTVDNPEVAPSIAE